MGIISNISSFKKKAEKTKIDLIFFTALGRAMPRVKKDPSVPLFEFTVNTQKNLKESTLKNYKKYLNNIAELSYHGHQEDERIPLITKRQDIYDNPMMVIKLIKAHTENRRELCGYYSAIFYALGRQDLDKDKTVLPIVQEFRRTYYTPEYQAKLKEEGKLDS